MTEAVLKQWQEVQSSGSSGRCRLAERSVGRVSSAAAQSLDYLDGVVGQVTGRDVEFTHDVIPSA